MLERRLRDQHGMGAYPFFVEPMATVWGFQNSKGRQFKMSTADLVTAFTEILAAWDDWIGHGLNVNAANPDDTLVEFARQHFSPGTHQVAANDQRRGFLHLISSLAYLSVNEAPFDRQASETPLPRGNYERALALLQDIGDHAEELYEGRQERAEDEPMSAEAGKNIIFYGAPGTGKSHRVDNMIGEQVSIRTVFHPDTQNSDFFGSLKPSMDGRDVVYGFAPGPMARALVDAHNSPGIHHFLVIEELNRAPAAAVFGELFQLLDRRPDGRSNYSLDFPTPESRKWFASKGYDGARLVLPANLSIIATMNSADQGVHPLDTAFRRRWEQEYMPLDEGEGPLGNLSFVDRAGALREIGWKAFATVLNSYLLDVIQIAEDRLFGLWFLKEAELDGPIPDKILLYLLDDLLRHEGRETVFASGVQSYGQLAARLSREEKVLSDALLERLEAEAHQVNAAVLGEGNDDEMPADV